jgi:hypothetical protein
VRVCVCVLEMTRGDVREELCSTQSQGGSVLFGSDVRRSEFTTISDLCAVWP